MPNPPPPGPEPFCDDDEDVVKWFSAPCQTFFSTYASDRSSSTSWSCHVCVGSRCKNMMISCGLVRCAQLRLAAKSFGVTGLTWKSMSLRRSVYLTRSAEQTYKWNCEKASVPSA